MKILIADDDRVSRRLLQTTLTKWGYEVVACANGQSACEKLVAPDAPPVAVLDWVMPEPDGVEVCRRVRAVARTIPTYILLLTTRATKDDVVKGLRAGADDYLTKPFSHEELQARLQVGIRLVELQQRLADRVADLESALARVRLLHGLLPICAYCKRIRDDSNYWQQVENYISEHSEASFTHGICPECYKKAEAELNAMQRNNSKS